MLALHLAAELAYSLVGLAQSLPHMACRCCPAEIAAWEQSVDFCMYAGQAATALAMAWPHA